MKVAILISGRGSNMAALVDACAAGIVPAEVGLVLSNRAGADGLAFAEAHGLATAVVDHKGFDTREDFDAALDAAIRDAGCDFVCLAGFMRVLTDGFMRGWRNRMLNIHPSLLPAFPGLNCHERAIAAGVRVSGCTVHFTRPELDSGPIVLQAAVPVLPGDDAGALAARILESEHVIYPMALKLVAEGRVRVHGEAVQIDGATYAEGALVNPRAV